MKIKCLPHSDETIKYIYPDNSECILDKEVEYECDDTDEGEDGDPGTLPSLRLVQLLTGDSPAQTVMRTGWTRELTILQNIIPQLAQCSSQLLHVEIDGVVVLESTHDICPIFTEIKSVVENYFVTEQQQ